MIIVIMIYTKMFLLLSTNVAAAFKANTTLLAVLLSSLLLLFYVEEKRGDVLVNILLFPFNQSLLSNYQRNYIHFPFQCCLLEEIIEIGSQVITNLVKWPQQKIEKSFFFLILLLIWPHAETRSLWLIDCG